VDAFGKENESRESTDDKEYIETAQWLPNVAAICNSAEQNARNN
jgi:hypothetical protein